MDRKLAAILAANVMGYAALTERGEKDTRAGRNDFIWIGPWTR